MDDIFDFLDEIVVKKNNPSTRVSLQSFLSKYVEISRNGGNSIDVAKELGISPQGVRQRAGKLIKSGVKLPRLGNICRKEISSFSSLKEETT